ncbi:ROK family glucokinase [Streptomonospora nanhaiensis]|uniref:Glucokinase n=3 Tax=Streptomonospora nanhaiensis TaxID=1323731 RepID=A0A853BPE9_9ACTN|nr:ROK family glucokinase [Streptomonospora nanhaiensis]MBV2364950.1 ROK family glucokinase [Streptomonospora nanhaiensis]NYI97529.1 glucokinase [Streptomonospora nanhaiensis]
MVISWGGDRLYQRGLAIGVDIGGSKVAAGVVNPAGRVLERVRTETPDRSKSPKVVEDTIVGVVEELRRRHPVRAVGIGAAGFVDEQRANVLFAPHLSWREEPLRDALRDRLELPVVVENDANAAAWAEARVGAGRGASDVVVVNLGTGIGGAVVIDGELYRGRHGIAGEFGHMTVVPGGHRCECGNRGCWEQYASGNAVTREAREMAAADSPVARALLSAVAGDPRLITGPLVSELAAEGDRACVELMEEAGTWLGVGLANLAAAFDPELFVIGGGVSESGELLLAPARRAFRRSLTGRGYRPEARIEAAELGNEAGLIGAADLARDALPRRRQGRRQGRIGRPARRRRRPGAPE